MSQKIYIDIAGHQFEIDTPNAVLTKTLLPSFQPFFIEEPQQFINNSEDANSTVKPLFHFIGNSNIVIPDEEPIEKMSFEETEFYVYNTDKGITISMNMGDKTYNMLANKERTLFSSNLTLLEKHENQFLLYLLRAAYGMSVIHHRTIKIHASVIEKGGKALVFLGKSGTGKSTHSRLWKEFVKGSNLLNDDEPIIRLLDNGTVRVYGAPWSGSTPCYINTSAEVSAFVHLYQNHENKLKQLSGIEAFTSLFQSSAILRSDKIGRELTLSLVADIVDKVPYYRLDNRPDREAVSLTETLMG